MFMPLFVSASGLNYMVWPSITFYVNIHNSKSSDTNNKLNLTVYQAYDLLRYLNIMINASLTVIADLKASNI